MSKIKLLKKLQISLIVCFVILQITTVMDIVRFPDQQGFAEVIKLLSFVLMNLLSAIYVIAALTKRKELQKVDWVYFVISILILLQIGTVILGLPVIFIFG